MVIILTPYVIEKNQLPTNQNGFFLCDIIILYNIIIAFYKFTHNTAWYNNSKSTAPAGSPQGFRNASL
jgi:hypothetical protein